MTPKFAVVGHPNKGKSSIVSTLAEDASVAISATPGTTTKARHFPLKVDGQLIYELIDTPGFQRPQQVLAWMQAQSQQASDRADVVAKFVEMHQTDKKYHDECELLKPLVDGAGILYVVDGSRPFGPEYETEMQILRWTGQPRMALINLIGEKDHSDDWRRALDQYFSLVRVFDAMHADVDTRLALLRSFSQIHPPWQSAIEHAVSVLEQEYSRRRRNSANRISELLDVVLCGTERRTIDESDNINTVQTALEARLRNRLREEEVRTHRDITAIYRHSDAQIGDLDITPLSADPFSRESESLFGLTKLQLAATGAVSGGIAGTGIDVMVGGTSLMAGAVLGAVIGSLSAVFGSDKLGKIKVLGQSLGEKTLIVGPFKSPNLPWVMLARCLLLHQVVSERNHARRDAIIVDTGSSSNLAGLLEKSVREKFEREFTTLRNDAGDGDKAALRELIFEVLGRSFVPNKPAPSLPEEPKA
ncbi:MAG: GTPase/DUF3482 domain-containing protein [Pseudomonadota bacterium]